MRVNGAWWPCHVTLGRDSKTETLMDLSGLSRREAVGIISLMLSWAQEFTKDGVITPRRLPAVARAADWTGTPESFARALSEAGWLDVHDEAWLVHDFDLYGGRLHAERERNRERQARHRERQGKAIPMPSADPVTVMSPLRHAHSGVMSPSRGEETREEEIREEKITPMAPAGGGELALFEKVPDSCEESGDERPSIQDTGPKYTGEFLAFWKAYPASDRKEGKAPAFGVWKRHRLSPTAISCAMARLEEDKASRKWREESGRFIPGPAAWLNKKRWLDDPAPAPVPAASVNPEDKYKWS